MTNSKKQFLDKKKKEQYYKLANGKNIRARSFFKLEQIDKKFNIIKDNLIIIDLGSAPGGWLQYIDNKITYGKLIGIDLLEIVNKFEFSDNVTIIEDDFNNINNHINEQFDLITSDMAPEFSGNNKIDRGKTHNLNLKTLKFSKENLKKGGNLIFKTFEGEDLKNVRNTALKIFKDIKEYKPKSSQKKSAETFIICFNKK